MTETSRDLDARWDDLTLDQKKATLKARNSAVEKILRPVLKVGDRIRATKAECGAREATFTFDGWHGGWILSLSGCSIAPSQVYSVNGEIIRV